MRIIFENAEVEDGEALLEVQKRAFQESLNIYRDYSTNPMFEEIEKILFKIENQNYYKIIFESKIIGGIHGYKKSLHHYYLNRLFIDPDYENLGIGKKALEFIESEGEFSNAERWTLDTPHKSQKNHYFYEKCGYERTGYGEQINDKLILIRYVKIMRRYI